MHKAEELFGGADQLPENAIVAHIDGGARGNPGPAGFGAVIEDASGRPLAELSQYLGVQTNNVAEYSALLAVLEYAVKHGHRALRVISDSELLVKQMKGQYKVNNLVLREMVGKARELIVKLDWFRVSHVLRAQNRQADRLANAAMDRGTGRSPDAPPRAAHPAPETPGEVNGIVVDGHVEFTTGSLPDGTTVKIRPVGRR
jgi:ribonuclease HI